MEFSKPGKHYDIHDCDRFDLGNRVVYVAQDRTCVFVAESHDANAREPHRASEIEIQGLWNEYRLIALLPVFRSMHSAQHPA